MQAQPSNALQFSSYNDLRVFTPRADVVTLDRNYRSTQPILDAANGVIQIITKHGQLGQQHGSWRAKLQRGQTDWGLGRRESFTTCTAERIAAKLPDGSAAWPGCSGKSAGSVLGLTSLDADGVLRTGNLGQASVSLTGGGNGYSYFTTVDQNTEQGVWRNSENRCCK